MDVACHGLLRWYPWHVLHGRTAPSVAPIPCKPLASMLGAVDMVSITNVAKERTIVLCCKGIDELASP